MNCIKMSNYQTGHLHQPQAEPTRPMHMATSGHQAQATPKVGKYGLKKASRLAWTFPLEQSRPSALAV